MLGSGGFKIQPENVERSKWLKNMQRTCTFLKIITDFFNPGGGTAFRGKLREEVTECSRGRQGKDGSDTPLAIGQIYFMSECLLFARHSSRSLACISEQNRWYTASIISNDGAR